MSLQVSSDTGLEQARASEKRTYSVLEISEILECSKNKAYDLCREGKFKIVHVGKSIRISKASFDAWLDNSTNC